MKKGGGGTIDPKLKEGLTQEIDVTGALTSATDPTTKLERNAEDLRKVFYQKMYALPGGTDANRTRNYANLHADTKSLFFLYADADLTSLYKKVAASPPGSADDELGMIETAYGEFLNRYLESPGTHRTGQMLSSRIAELNRYHSLSRDEQTDDPNSVMFDAFYGSDTEGIKNRERLWSMSITRGQKGYYSDRILASVNKLASYYRNTGKTEEEVFRLLTSIGSSPAAPPETVDAFAGTDYGEDPEF